MRLQGSVCLVTGATSGIGCAAARALSEAGADVIVSGRDQAALDEIAGTVRGTALACDLAEIGAGSRLTAEALAVRGRVDVLVNCAGVGLFGPASELSDHEVERLMRINVTAPIELTSALLPGMRSEEHTS